MKWIIIILSLCLLIAFAGCVKRAPVDRKDGKDAKADADGHTVPTPETIRHNAQVRDELPLSDPRDFVDARKELVALIHSMGISFKKAISQAADCSSTAWCPTA